MRNVKYAAIAAALLVVAGGLAIWQAQKPKGGSTTDAVATPPARAKSEGKDSSARPTMPGSPGTGAASSATAGGSPEKMAAVMQEIQQATVEYSETELPRFDKWLRDSNPEIRKAAARGLLDSGLAGGAPMLRDAALRTKDPEEIQEYNRAATILELPPATAKDLKMKKKEGAPAPRRFTMKDGVLIPAPGNPPAPAPTPVAPAPEK